MVEITKAKMAFKEYVKPYDVTNGRIRVKIAHTMRVSAYAKKIAESLNLSKEDIEIAELIGLLHDIGRFEQIRIYNTYIDRESVDHAKLGVKILFEEGIIRKFIKDNTNDELIKIAISNHNKFKIDDGLTNRQLIHSKIIRDADKLDIFDIITTEPLKDALSYPIDNIEYEKLNPKMHQDFINAKPTDKADIKSNIDCMVIWVAFVFDLYFKESVKTVYDAKYIDKIIDRVNYKDYETAKYMLEIRKFANDYLRKRIEEND